MKMQRLNANLFSMNFQIFFKLNVNGDGVIFNQSRLHLCMDQTPEKFDFERFRQMCIFSGCDYLESINGIGLGRAKKVFTMTVHSELEIVSVSLHSIFSTKVKHD